MVWRALPLSVIRNLWYEINKRVFDGVECPIFVIKEHIFAFLVWLDLCFRQAFFQRHLLIWLTLFICDLYSLKRVCTHLIMRLSLFLFLIKFLLINKKKCIKPLLCWSCIKVILHIIVLTHKSLHCPIKINYYYILKNKL